MVSLPLVICLDVVVCIAVDGLLVLGAVAVKNREIKSNNITLKSTKHYYVIEISNKD